MHDIKHRSWGSFGSSVAATGFCLIAVGITYPICTKQFGILPILLILPGILLAVAGIKVVTWDMSEEAQMSRVNNLQKYRYKLVTGGVEREMKKFSEVEDAYKRFCENKEELCLKISPPIGDLAQWKCYYDPVLQYVIEVTLIKPDGRQVWCRSCNEPAINDLKRIKTIITKKKRVRLYLMQNPEVLKRYAENPRMIYLEENAKDLGFEVVTARNGVDLRSENVPSAKQVYALLGKMSINEYIFFWNYYHRTVSDPGSYISAYVSNGKAIIMEANHGWSGNFQQIKIEDLVELILRNWEKDCSRQGEFKNSIRIQKTIYPEDIWEKMNNVTQIYKPNYEIKAF